MKYSRGTYRSILNMTDHNHHEFMHVSRQMSGITEHDTFHPHIHLKKDKYAPLIHKNVTKHTKHSLLKSIKCGRLTVDPKNDHNETSFSTSRVLQMLHENHKSYGGNSYKHVHPRDPYKKKRNVKNDYSRNKVFLTKYDKYIADLVKSAYHKESRLSTYLDYKIFSRLK